MADARTTATHTDGLTAAPEMRVALGAAQVKYADPLTTPVSECFHVRVLIPCYTEALEIVQPTLMAVANATMPKARTLHAQSGFSVLLKCGPDVP